MGNVFCEYVLFCTVFIEIYSNDFTDVNAGKAIGITDEKLIIPNFSLELDLDCVWL